MENLLSRDDEQKQGPAGETGRQEEQRVMHPLSVRRIS